MFTSLQVYGPWFVWVFAFTVQLLAMLGLGVGGLLVARWSKGAAAAVLLSAVVFAAPSVLTVLVGVTVYVVPMLLPNAWAWNIWWVPGVVEATYPLLYALAIALLTGALLALGHQVRLARDDAD